MTHILYTPLSFIFYLLTPSPFTSPISSISSFFLSYHSSLRHFSPLLFLFSSLVLSSPHFSPRIIFLLFSHLLSHLLFSSALFISLFSLFSFHTCLFFILLPLSSPIFSPLPSTLPSTPLFFSLLSSLTSPIFYPLLSPHLFALLCHR